jgi:hypothetical protein
MDQCLRCAHPAHPTKTCQENTDPDFPDAGTDCGCTPVQVHEVFAAERRAQHLARFSDGELRSRLNDLLVQCDKEQKAYPATGKAGYLYVEEIYRLLGLSSEGKIRESRAAAELSQMIEQGRAAEVLEAYDDHHLSCGYVAGIISHVAAEGSEMTAQEFARSLQEEAQK